MRNDSDYRLAAPYRAAKNGFPQATGALQAAGAKLWIDEFSEISDSTLKAKCPIPKDAETGSGG
jgi:hypothetical protein